ncbi:MAG: hypothetical protein HQ536_04505 [Parcubacteria group bacterium]|nr:hypothetical protein [Parcubacteria group bacterium]
MGRSEKFVLVFSIVVFFILGCGKDEECPECVCEECLECSECICEECLECSECVCEECPDCFYNPLAGEYFFHSMGINTARYGPVRFSSADDSRFTTLSGNVSMGQSESISNDFYMHFVYSTKNSEMFPGKPVRGEFYFSGKYLFDDRNLFIIDMDGNLMKFLYSVSNVNGVDYLYLLPYNLDDDDEGDILDIGLQRVGDSGECGLVGENFGHCYEDSHCENEFENGCYDEDSCYFMSGDSWRQCNWDEDNLLHENNGLCETM